MINLNEEQMKKVAEYKKNLYQTMSESENISPELVEYCVEQYAISISNGESDGEILFD